MPKLTKKATGLSAFARQPAAAAADPAPKRTTPAGRKPTGARLPMQHWRRLHEVALDLGEREGGRVSTNAVIIRALEMYFAHLGVPVEPAESGD